MSMPITIPTVAASLLLALSSVNCASAVNTDDGTSATDATTGPDAPLPRGDDWQGYVESYHFRSGSDHVRIVFETATGDGARTGVVVFGDGTAPPRATDPTVGYPPAFDLMNAASLIVEGFRYPIVDGRVTGSRVQLTVNLAAVWSDWCALQTPVAQDTTGELFGCLPNAATSTDADGGCSYTDPMSQSHVAVDCTRLYLCRTAHVCECDSAACRSGSMAGQVAFDFQISGDRGDGTAMLDLSRNVHLMRH